MGIGSRFLEGGLIVRGPLIQAERTSRMAVARLLIASIQPTWRSALSALVQPVVNGADVSRGHIQGAAAMPKGRFGLSSRVENGCGGHCRSRPSSRKRGRSGRAPSPLSRLAHFRHGLLEDEREVKLYKMIGSIVHGSIDPDFVSKARAEPVIARLDMEARPHC